MGVANGRVLIFGASGSVGPRVRERFGDRVAAATYANTPITGGQRFDLLTMGLGDLRFDPDGVTHALILAADSKPDSCLVDPVRSQALNVDCVVSLCRELLDTGIRPVFASTEFVFDGARGEYGEGDEARPILLYGRQKLAAERALTALDERVLIYRLAKVYGDTPGDGTLLTGWVEPLMREGVLRCATDQAFSPVFVGDVAEALACGVDRNLSGLYHLSGGRRFTRLALLEMFAGKLAVHRQVKAPVEPCGIHDFPLPEPRPVDVSMRNDKLVADTGMVFQSVEDVCERIVARAFA